MAPPPTTYFLVPGWKDEEFSSEVCLGNIISDTDAPHEAVYNPSESNPIVALDKPFKTKTVTDFKRVIGDEKRSKVGLFAKILELLGPGVNVSHSDTDSDTEKYAVGRMTLRTFRPTHDFLRLVVQPDEVQEQLTEGEGNCVFLITGTIIAEKITYTTKVSQEDSNEGSVGINAHGFNFGPNASRTKKKTREREFTEEGPTLLAFRVQKIQLDADDQPVVSVHDGEFYDGDLGAIESKLKTPALDAHLNAHDLAGMSIVKTVMDIDVEEDEETECQLIYPKNTVK